MINITVQYIVTDKSVCPDEAQLSEWANSANININKKVELTIRIVEEAESSELNQRYRNKNSATNVLAFPFDDDVGGELSLLGDLVICAQIIVAEAEQQSKTEMEHWAHIVIHGVLHLQGLDHISSQQAEEMEFLETKILKTLGYKNPYQVDAL